MSPRLADAKFAKDYISRANHANELIGLRWSDLSRAFRMTAAMKAKTFRVDIERDDTLFIATSPDLKGMLVAEHSLDDLIAAIPSAVQDLFAACDVRVVVSQVDDGDEMSGPWVAFPAEIARKGLERVA